VPRYRSELQWRTVLDSYERPARNSCGRLQVVPLTETPTCSPSPLSIFFQATVGEQERLRNVELTADMPFSTHTASRFSLHSAYFIYSNGWKDSLFGALMHFWPSCVTTACTQIAQQYDLYDDTIFAGVLHTGAQTGKKFDVSAL